jgi:paraquat-inducible protein B
MLPNQQKIYRRKGLEMVKNLIFSAITALILTGCIETTHKFMIRFNDIEGLRKNDQVFFDKTPIGVVTDVEYTDSGNYLVKVAVEDQYSSLPKDSSMFYIDSNPENESQKAVRIIQIGEDGNTIEKNAIVEGQTKYAAIYGQIANKFRKNVRVMESEINEFFKGFQNLTEDEQIIQLERQLDKILAEIENLGAQMKHKLETEILPRIREQIEELRRRLEEIGKEEKLKYVDQKIETISAKL